MLTNPMDITPRRYRTDLISYRGVITPRNKYPTYVHSILAGRSRDILHTVIWNVKTETSSYLRDVFSHKRPSLRWMESCGTSSRVITPRCHWIHVSLGLILSLTTSLQNEYYVAIYVLVRDVMNRVMGMLDLKVALKYDFYFS
jgi:hypothetical protein